MNKLSKKLTAGVLSLAVAVSALPLNAFAEEPAERVKVISDTFSFRNDKDFVFYYSDDYFAASGKEKNEHLRTMSLCLAMAAAGNRDHTPGYAVELPAKIGFEDVQTYDFNVEPTEDTIACTISHKETNNGEILAVGIRGVNYDDEVVNLVVSGTEGDAEGFSEATKKIVDRIKKYEADNDLSGAKIWITGFSRSACIADLTGKYINQHLDEFGITDDDLYAYTFETPAASAEDTNYENIHNILNPDDIVTKVYPAEWNLTTCGVDEIIEQDEPQTVQLKKLDFSGGFAIVDSTDSVDGKDVPKAPVKDSEFAETFVKLLTDNITREEFAAVGPTIGKILTMYLDLPSEKKEAIADFAKSAFKDINYIQALAVIAPLITAQKGTDAYTAAVANLSDFLIGLFDAQDHSAALTDTQYMMIKAAFPKLLELLVPVVVADLSNPNGMLSTIVTFFANINQLTFDQHEPIVVFDIVKKYDSYYTDNIEIARGTATYVNEVMPDEVLYDDEALIAKGFNETDIEYLKKGYDVTYGVYYVDNSVAFYEAMEDDSPVKARIDDYLDKIDAKAVECYSLELFGYRERGFEEAEELTADFNPVYSGPLINAQGLEISSDDVKVLYLGGADDEDYTDLEAEVNTDDADGIPYLSFKFVGRGLYVLMHVEPNKPEESSETESSESEISSETESSEPEESSEAESSEAEESSKTADTSSRSADNNPNTGAAIPAAVLFVLGAVLVVFLAKKKK